MRLRNLDEIEKAVVSALLKAREPVSQVTLIGRLKVVKAQATVSRAMNRLIRDGVIVKLGNTRGASFALSETASWFAKPPQMRPPVDYDTARIGDYIPNETHWLPERLRARMSEAATGVSHPLDASTYSREIAERFLVDLAWASSALEGNTYEYLDTEVLLKYGQRASGHDATEVTMILNHKYAISELLDHVTEQVLEPRFISRIHALLMKDLISPEDLGRTRANAVRISSSSYRPSENARVLAGDLGILLWKAEHVQDPFEASFLLLCGLSYLQSFVDGNERMGRLTCNVPLLWSGLPPMSFIGVDRSDYLTGLIVFYETGDTGILADAIVQGYELSTPSYAAAVSTKRVPRTIEIRERKRIGQIVKDLIHEHLDADVPIDSGRIDSMLEDLPMADQQILSEKILEILKGLSIDNSIAWDVDVETAERYVLRRDSGGPSPVFVR